MTGNETIWARTGMSTIPPELHAAGRADSGGPACRPGLVLHVSPGGADTNPGSGERPFATVEAARDALRERKRSGGLPVGGAAVFVHEGSYRFCASLAFEEEDSGTHDSPVVYCAEPGTVRLKGSLDLACDSFEPVTDAALRARLDPSAREHIRCFDLTRLGNVDLGSFPETFRGAPPVPELFFNDCRMTLARWPNEGWTTIASIVDPGSKGRGEDEIRLPVFEYEGGRPERWSVDRGVWLRGYWCFDWFEETIRVKQIDAAQGQITLAAPHQYMVRQGNPSPRRFCALNVLEELDAPGEYYIDRENRALYFWPPAPLDGARITLSTLNAPVLSLDSCRHMTVRGFTVEDSLACAIAVNGGHNVRIEGCTIRNTRLRGIDVIGGTGHRIDSCDIADTGTGGLLLEGGDRRTLAPGGHLAVNNHIHHFSRHQLTYASAIHLSGVGNTAAHNLIHDAPHMAVGVSGNDHVFEYNVVHHVCTETDDCGAYYKGRNPSCTGNIVRYNFWHHVGSPMGHGNAAVYFDDGDVGDEVIGNIFFRCGEPGRGSFGTVFSHGGHDLLVDSNVFIECRRAVGSSPWNDARWAAYIEAELWQTRLLEEVDITRPPYTTKYPFLIGFMAPQPGQTRINRARRNLFVMCGEVSSGNWQWFAEENVLTDSDPGFADIAAGDFRLHADSDAGRMLPEVVRLPFSQMGLVQSPLRPEPVRERWSYDPPQPLEPPQKRVAGPAVVRTGPVPVCRVSLSAAAFDIPPAGAFEEWQPPEGTTELGIAVDPGGTTVHRPSTAWLSCRDRVLTLVVSNSIHPATDLTGNRWGQDDAVEVSLRPQGRQPPAPIYVLRGYGNGRLEFGSTPDGGTEPATMEPAEIRYRAERPADDRWIAVFAIPLHMVDLSGDPPQRAAFEITVRKARDEVWAMWVPTHGRSYDADMAGILEITL